MEEKDITQALSLYLNGHGYATWPHHSSPSSWHGPDIVAYHPERHHLWLIEAKGDAVGNKNNPNGSITRRSRFESSLGQICQREAAVWKPKAGFGSLLPSDTISYGLAFSDEYRRLCSHIRPDVWASLALYQFFLRPNDPVPTIIG
jgi:hypothetical protein